MLMSLSSTEVLVRKGVFAETGVTPAVRRNEFGAYETIDRAYACLQLAADRGCRD